MKEHTPNPTTTTTTTHTRKQGSPGTSILRPAPEHLAFNHLSEELMTHINSRVARECKYQCSKHMIQYYFVHSLDYRILLHTPFQSKTNTLSRGTPSTFILTSSFIIKTANTGFNDTHAKVHVQKTFIFPDVWMTVLNHSVVFSMESEVCAGSVTLVSVNTKISAVELKLLQCECYDSVAQHNTLGRLYNE